MDLFNSIFGSLLRLYFAAFSWAPPALGLTVLSALVGVAMLWVFGKTSDQARMKAVKNKVWAALFELRVYVDEPRVTWRARRHRHHGHEPRLESEFPRAATGAAARSARYRSAGARHRCARGELAH